MHGGKQHLYEFDTRDRINAQNIYKNIYQNKIQTESKSLLNVNQTFKTKDQSANYLIEYFEGMILSYISLNEEQGIRNDKLKNFILSHDKNKFRGGDENNVSDNKYIKEHKTYKEYKKDEDIKDKDILQFSKDNWGHISIKINIDYGSVYDININHNNGNNVINLIIDLQHNTIIDNIQKSYNNNLCDYTKNIVYILSQIIKIILKYIYRDEHHDNISLCICDGNNNVIEGYNENTFDGVVSLLIMILTLKNNTDEDTYKKYNTTLLLSGVYEKFTRDDINYLNSFDVFHINNKNVLTYRERDHHLIGYKGDCALNTLMCVKNTDIRELFVDKISFSQNKFVKKEKKESEYYFNKINNVLDELPIIEELSWYKENIKDIIKNYNEFINFINNEYSNFKNAVIDKNYLDLDKKYQDKFETMHRRCIQFVNIFRNNLLDYNFKEIEEIFKKLDEVKNMKEMYVYEDYEGEQEMLRNLEKGIFKERKKPADDEWDDFEEDAYDADHTKSLRKFMEIIEVIIKYKDTLNIFYINTLITLLLIKHKINYLFDTNVMKILKHTENKIDIIKCFRNVCYNEKEYGVGLPEYQEGDEKEDGKEDKYLFKFTCIKSFLHAVVLIINIDTDNNKVFYIYDINDLNMYCTEKYNMNHICKSQTYAAAEEYYVDNKSPRWIIKKYYSQMVGDYKKDEIIMLMDNITFNMDVVKSLNKISIFNEKGNFDFKKLNVLKYDECNEDNFNSVYYNYKKIIFKQLLDYCNSFENEYMQSSNNDFLYTVHFINDYINENIINYNNSTKNLLYIIFDCLVQCNYNLQLRKGIYINIDKEYKNILKYMTDTYSLATGKIGKYLDFIHDNNNERNELVRLIVDIMKKLRFWTKGFKIVHGGNDVNVNCCNSIIKKILIILLIVVIIIIIVLIVLYIINKYKNNNP